MATLCEFPLHQVRGGGLVASVHAKAHYLILDLEVYTWSIRTENVIMESLGAVFALYAAIYIQYLLVYIYTSFFRRFFII